MASREKALRRILDAVGGRLSQDQRREILGHLEDSVEAKVRAGLGEGDAIATAVEDLGDLTKMIRGFQGPLAALAEGPALIPASRSLAVATCLLLWCNALVLIYVVPAFRDVFDLVGVAMPRVTQYVVATGELAELLAPAILGGLVLITLGFPWLLRRGSSVGVLAWFATALAAALAGMGVAVSLMAVL